MDSKRTGSNNNVRQAPQKVCDFPSFFSAFLLFSFLFPISLSLFLLFQSKMKINMNKINGLILQEKRRGFTVLHQGKGLLSLLMT